MKFNSLFAKTIAQKHKISQPTDLLTTHDFIVLDELLIEKYGLSFSVFFSKIITKYQALMQSPNFNGGEFWWTGNEINKKTGLSYHIHRKMIQLGQELGLWTCQAKFNPSFPGHHINKTNHFILNFDAIALFIYNLNNETKPLDKDLINYEAEQEEIERIEEKASKTQFSISEQEIIEYAKIMSSQDGIKSAKSYKLQIMLKALNGDKTTLNKMNIWKRLKSFNSPINNTRTELENIKGLYFVDENIKYKIIDLIHDENMYMVSGTSSDHNRNVVFIEQKDFNNWVNTLEKERDNEITF